MVSTISYHLNKFGFFHSKSVIDSHNCIFLRDYLLSSYCSQHAELISHPTLKNFYSLSNLFPTYNLSSISNLLSDDPASYSSCYTIWGMTSVESRISYQFLKPLFTDDLIALLSTAFYGSNDSSLPLYMHSPASVRVIYPGNSVAYVPNHADCQYNSFLVSNSSKRTSFPFLTCWIPLQGSPSINGGLHVYPSEFHVQKDNSFVPYRGWINDSLSLEDVIKHLIDYSPSDAVIFNPFLYHGSSPNLSNDVDSSNFRISIDFRFFGNGTFTSKHYLDIRSLKFYEPFTGPCSLQSSSSGN